MADSTINARVSWKSSIKRHLKGQASSTVTIPKVPERLRRGEKDAYEPRIISFGPYHHGRPSLQAMEKYKWSFLEVILSFRPETPWERYIEAIKEEEAKIRTCYTVDFDIDSEEFVEMMLIDGCFLVGHLLQIFYFGFPSELELELESIAGMNSLIRYDILLLENQLPFFILIKIFDLLQFTPTSRPSSFMDLAIHYFNCWKSEKKVNFQPPQSAHHLLHLYHSRCLYTLAGEVSLAPIPGNQSGPKHQPRSVTVLHEAGVKFEKQEMNESSSLDVTFDITNGKMMIPPLVIDTFNKSRLRNLVAFEQLYPNFFKEFNKSFTAYVEFMDFIINTPEDVALLHKEGILCHYLGSDKNAANFLNDLNQGVFVQSNHYLAPLYKDVYDYQQKKLKKWQAMLRHNYCNSPWAILGIVVGGILLVFTLIQTIFSGISAF